ncbi:GIY-YIG nuclease family protein [Nocardioides dubius]|uniref:GIY-YIG nuclease family protein n=1 Tax=Nocardioides dubius TaxID=317019 RepID=A0ABN1TUP9_9ACTN
MNGYCYILECSDGSYYVGSTVDLERRLSQHELGIGAAYTRSRRPVRLVWYECYPRIDAAYAREKQIQNWGRDKRRALIEGRADELPLLARNYADRFSGE